MSGIHHINDVTLYGFSGEPVETMDETLILK